MNDLKRIQKAELAMLKFFHDTCNQHELKYFALGGTLLGAIRHQGFIPWDDDIDIGMPRLDYENFIQIAEKVLPTHYALIPNPANLNILQLVDKRIKIKNGKNLSYIFIDIFPLDGYPNSTIKKRLHQFSILFNRMLCKLTSLDNIVERDRGFIENTLVRFARLVRLDKIIDREKQHIKLHEMIKRYRYEDSVLVGNILGRYREKEVVLKTIFSDGAYYPFEDIDIIGPSNAKHYLEHIYGDYMKLPPEEDRVGHHLTIIETIE